MIQDSKERFGLASTEGIANVARDSKERLARAHERLEAMKQLAGGEEEESGTVVAAHEKVMEFVKQLREQREKMEGAWKKGTENRKDEL
eukprot:CAMPEP_0202454778 /NCGR_PEP_ID=MMETSP1360-20130828/12432_1 /ASSEMBLY_ACC=CAM_ASM_000848 /TAXON_ID=515479 /ORGANISM="Licmophora paradoxa, Strain CCMP2313" /LENGTH=88 /DNA_ID=CAMNT_0049074183 /DNA_START=259 /DNA_END=525 /DNA_ORIENTATION=-